MAESGALRAMLLLLGMLIVFFVGGFITSKFGKRHAARLQEEPNQLEEEAAEETDAQSEIPEGPIETIEDSKPEDDSQNMQEGEQNEKN